MNDTSVNRSNRCGRRPRIVLLAYFCKPDHGSEFSVGWNRAIQAGRYADTWAICETNENETSVSRCIARYGPVPGVRFVYVPQPKIEKKLRKIPGCFYLMYYFWHRRAFAIARQLHAENRFDLAHQVTSVGFREPGFLWRLPIPFIWGPVGGTQNFPYRFLPYFGLRHGAVELVRNVLNSLQLYASGRVHSAARKAAAVLAANSTNERDLRRACGVPVTRLLEAGISQVAAGNSRPVPVAGPLRILWSGYIKTNKALPLLIDALTLLPGDLPWELRVLGNGSMFRTCRRLAERHGLNDRIEWLGWQHHDEAIKHFSWADVFVFTSLRDTTGTVVLEALSQGVPVICLDHQGVAEVISPECGLKIPVTWPQQVVRDLAQALAQLGRHPEQLHRLREGARRRAEYFLWSRQGERMAAIYQRVLTDAGSDAELQERNESSIQHIGCQTEVLA